MKHLQSVRDLAARHKLLDDGGELKQLDSLTLIDFVTTLEDELHVEIRSSAINKDNFKSLESIARMLGDG